MKRLLTGCLLLLAGSLAQATPDFRNSADFDLSSYRGHVLYLDFWASWCVPCRLSFPWLIETQQRFAGQGLQVLAINVDSDKEDADAFLRGHATNFPIVLDPDGELAGHYRIQGMPSAVLIGRDGRILQTHTGFRQQDKPELEAAIRAALNTGEKR